MKPKYQQQLVLQLPGSSLKDYDALIALENSLIDCIGTLGKVDGHDMGLGEMNIFIHTNHAVLLFEKIKLLLGTSDFIPQLKVAYREIGKDDYTILYPNDLNHFAVG